MIHPENKVLKANRSKKIESARSQVDLSSKLSFPDPLDGFPIAEHPLRKILLTYDRFIPCGIFPRMHIADDKDLKHTIRFLIRPGIPLYLYFATALKDPENLRQLLPPGLALFSLRHIPSLHIPRFPALICSPLSEDLTLRYFRSKDRKLVVLAQYPKLTEFLITHFSASSFSHDQLCRIQNQIYVLECIHHRRSYPEYRASYLNPPHSIAAALFETMKKERSSVFPQQSHPTYEENFMFPDIPEEQDTIQDQSGVACSSSPPPSNHPTNCSEAEHLAKVSDRQAVKKNLQRARKMKKKQQTMERRNWKQYHSD